MQSDSFSSEFYERWEHLISTCDIEDVPMRFIDKLIVFYENDDTSVFDIKAMIEEGKCAEQVENKIENFLSQYDEQIQSVDFIINVDAVAAEISEKTSKLLDQ